MRRWRDERVKKDISGKEKGWRQGIREFIHKERIDVTERSLLE